VLKKTEEKGSAIDDADYLKRNFLPGQTCIMLSWFCCLPAAFSPSSRALK
jgi:hypothetical protein